MNQPEMDIPSLVARTKLSRKVHGIAATLLPFDTDGKIAVESFQLYATGQAAFARLRYERRTTTGTPLGYVPHRVRVGVPASSPGYWSGHATRA